MKNIFTPNRISALLCLSMVPQIIYAADYLNFATTPPGTSSQEPSPNIIVSVDDSGSMGKEGIAELKAALKDTFARTNIPDDRVRLAWQSMNSCNGMAQTGPACGTSNAMKILKGQHRTNFLSWVDTLKEAGGTPSHTMVRNAGDYLMRTDLGVNSPWASDPGTKELPVLGCRKSFHIFMTDGGWNSSASNTNDHVDADRKTTAYKVIEKGNIDGKARTLPDGKTYTPDSATTDILTKIYSDPWGFATAGQVAGLNTLSDLAFYYWATDLQPTIENIVKPIIKVDKDKPDVVGGKTIPEYWNPKNNPATWQSLTTYTIGFGAAAKWAGAPVWGGDTYSGDYSKLLLGSMVWPGPLCGALRDQPCDGQTLYTARPDERKMELWHMAINGRGKFIPATDASSLSKAFKDILQNIVADTSNPVTSFASGSSSITSTSAGVYQSRYAAKGWTGGVVAFTAAKGTGKLTPNTKWGTLPSGDPMTSGDIMDAENATSSMANRAVYTYNASEGKPFVWTSLSPAQQNALREGVTGAPATTLAQNRLNFIRGDRRQEVARGGVLRDRVSRQGDIVNSALWYTPRPSSGYAFDGYSAFATAKKDREAMLYVGGNDGMLHGFSAVDGTEKIAYVPQGVYKNLAALTKTDYQSNHNYYVDGSPFTGDVNLTPKSSPTWRTMLVGTLGAGGKGYFVLDVTNPADFTTSAASAKAAVLMDLTDGVDADLGHIFAAPVTAEMNAQLATQITRMNDDRWAVVLGNGFNSTNEDPVLVIQYLDGGPDPMRKISAATGANGNGAANGLAAPRLVDLNGDGTPDIAYAGDLKGNLWKFDLSHSDPSKWGVAFGGAPFYTATEPVNTSEPQPITAAPVVRPSTGIPGMLVAFGTGQNLEVGDRVDTSPQTFYSMLDNTRYKIDGTPGANKGKILVDTSFVVPSVVGSLRDKLEKRTFDAESPVNTGGDTFWKMPEEQKKVDYTGTMKGWYLDLPVKGERVLQAPEFVDGSNVFEIRSLVPGSGGNTTGIEDQTCTPTSVPAKGFRTYLGIGQGLKPAAQLLDADGDGVYNGASDKDAGSNRTTAGDGIERGFKSGGETVLIGTDKDRKRGNLPAPPTSINWRQIQ